MAINHSVKKTLALKWWHRRSDRADARVHPRRRGHSGDI
jgi:hypothetical protein